MHSKINEKNILFAVQAYYLVLLFMTFVFIVVYIIITLSDQNQFCKTLKEVKVKDLFFRGKKLLVIISKSMTILLKYIDSVDTFAHIDCGQKYLVHIYP